MGEEEIIFLDTYAMFEIARDNPNYSKLPPRMSMITTIMNMYELYYGILGSQGQADAEQALRTFSECVIDFDLNTIRLASIFRHKNRNKKFSYIDCLGYAIAMTRNAKFLTGDKEFEGMPNVIFIK